MKPSQLVTLVTELIKNHQTGLIHGKPGIGKTSIIEQAAAAAGADVIKSFPGLEDPTEPGGYPWIAKDHSHAEKVLFGQAYQAVTATKETVWFLDDFGNGPPATQASYMQWLLARGVNGHRLPSCVTMLAATNGRTHRANVTGILEPVKSRFTTIVELVADLDEWTQWAIMQPFMPPDMVAYLRFQPDALCEFVPSADLVNCPLPRTWENAGRVCSMNLPKAVEAESLAGAIGEGRATAYLGFRTMYQQLPSIDGILLNPDTAAIPENLGALYAVTTGLAAKATEQNFGRVAKYAARLVDSARGDFAALCIRDAARRKPALQMTPDFVRLMAGELGQLVMGTVA